MQPDKLKRTEDFSRAFRGYKRNEVDEYIEEILEQYGELYRENKELVLRLQMYASREETIKEKEETVELRIKEASERAAGIVAVAEGRAREIVAAAKADGEAQLTEAKEKVAAQEEILLRVRTEAEAFHREMCGHYESEIAWLSALLEGAELPPEEPQKEAEESVLLFADEVESGGIPMEEAVAPARAVSEFSVVYGNRNYVKEVRQNMSVQKK